MSTPAPQPPAPTPAPVSPASPSAAPAHAKPADPGFFTRLEDKILPHTQQATADLSKAAGSLASLVPARSGEALDIAGDVLALVKLIDPADAPLVTAATALLPKVAAMAENAARDIRAALQTATRNL